MPVTRPANRMRGAPNRIATPQRVGGSLLASTPGSFLASVEGLKRRSRLCSVAAMLRLRREGEVIRGSVSHLCWARRQWRRAPLRGQAAKRPTEAVIGTREGDDMTEDTLMIQVRCRTCRTSERRLFLRGAVAPDNRNHMTPTWTSAAPYQHGGAREAGFK